MPRYRGRCHCGAIEFEVEGELEAVEYCNCSYCERVGFLHWYVAPVDFTLLRGADAVETYEFGTRTSRNRFCRACGVTPFRRPRSDPDKVDVNARCLEGVDLDALPVTRFDGRDWGRAMRDRGTRRGDGASASLPLRSGARDAKPAAK